MAIFQGSAPALITPFCKDGVDFKAFEQNIDFQINEGSDALVVCGTTGEPSTMSAREKMEVIECAIKKTAKRVPLIAGTGGNCTQEVVEASVEAQKLGADALLLVTPYYNKCTQNGLIKHYLAVADAVKIPIILYNVPARTGLNMTAATVHELSAHPNIAAVKEASGDFNQISEIARLCHGKLDIYSGDDGLVLPMMALGGLGVISVAANAIPRLMHNLCAAYFEGNIKRARELQLQLLPFMKSTVIEVNPIPIKTAVSLMGKCQPIFRMPLTNMEQKNLDVLKREMLALGLIKE